MSPYAKTILRTIKMTLPRFLAIFAIIALGVGFFSGLKVTTPSFIYTADLYSKEYQMFDYKFLSTIGFKQEDVDELAKRTGCTVEGSYSADCSAFLGNDESSDTVRFLSITNNVNKLKLEAGRLPEKPDEIVIDGYQVSTKRIGQKLVISSETSEDALEMFKYKEYTIVGTVRSPLYLNFQRGTSDEGSGNVSYFVCALPEAFDSEYFTEVYLYADTGLYIYSDAYKDWAKGAEDRYEDVLEDVVNERFDKLLKDEYKKLGDEVEEHFDEIDDGWKEINDARKELDDAKKELEDGEKEIKDNRKKLADAKKTLDSSKKKLEDAKSQLESGEKQLKDGKKKLDKAKKDLASTKKQLDQMKKGIDDGRAYVAYIRATMTPEQQAAAGIDADAMEKQLDATEAQYKIYIAAYNAGCKSYKDGKSDYDKNYKKFKTAKAQYNSGVKKYNKGVKQYNDGVKKLDDAQKELDDGWKEYNDGLREFWDGYYDFAQGVNKLYMGVVEGSTLIESADSPDTYVLGRDKNTGYVCFDNDASIVDGVAAVFPIFFFAIAALVCSTTMSRMVSDERGIIGTMRAMGYSDASIVMKYAIYAGSASVLGCVLGFLGGTKLFPAVIWEVYAMMYGFTTLEFTTSIPLFILSLGVALLCTVGVSVVTAMSALKGMPAELIRPKAPLPGKRILLERMGFIWKRLKFLHKVSARNVFRFKKRMWMMIVGIAGCTALLITAFGLHDSICNVIDIQFDTIMKYDLKVVFGDNYKQDEIAKAAEDAIKQTGISFDYVVTENDQAKNNGSAYVRDVDMFISDDPNVEKIFGLNDVKTGEALPWPSDGEVAISGKLADKNNVKAGDYITLQYGDDEREIKLKVSSVFTNYTFHYVLMTPTTYREAFGKNYRPETLLAAVEKKSPEDPYKVAAYLSDKHEIKTWFATADSRDSFAKTTERMNYVIVLIIVSAASLAFIVLFNLNNINITERIREIATLKVMGFNRKETGAYVTRENVILVMLGFLAGIPLGFLLHRYVMAQIAMDMVTYQVHIEPLSFVYALGFVLLFSAIVNLIMRAKIEKIDMAESLKSAE
ncbi:MAG: FtsX-like permease family protein [Clostridiales bacterium]|nr:FtsX-like permease family protein [Clostridiales bacterium]